ncbi:hypothetical protein MYX06_05345 [Patescibacteria group bacterium AH-259-L05]|nr:hypothetical protein [Patescibacteria group bacterium AH-259-L05]
MSLDEQLYRLPLIGWIIKRLYSYFKKNTAITDLMHVAAGLGIGFLIVGGTLTLWGIFALAIGVLGHVYAFIKGEK